MLGAEDLRPRRRAVRPTMNVPHFGSALAASTSELQSRHFAPGDLHRFAAAVVAAGWDLDETRLSLLRFAPLTPERVCGMATVLGRAGWSRSYPFSRRMSWVSELEKDLLQKVSDPASSRWRKK